MSAIGDASITEIIGFREATSDLNFTTLSLITVITILGICIYMSIKKTPRIYRTIVLMCCIIGAISIFISINEIASFHRPNITLTAGTNLARNPQAEIDFTKVFSLQYGGYGVIFGYVIAFIGALNIPNSNPSLEEDEQDDQRVHQGDEE